MHKVEEIVFLNEFVWNVGQFDADILGMTKGSFKIEVFDVEADEFHTGAREDAVDLHLEGFNQACVGANVTGVDDAIATSGSSLFGLYS